MPTSSQALISFHIDYGERHPLREQRSHASCIHRDPAPYHLAAAYNISDCVALNKSTVNAHEAAAALGRESAQLFKYHPLPKGYTSILVFDENDQSFHWQALAGYDESNVQAHCSYCDAGQEQKYGDRYLSESPDFQQRPYSAVPAGTQIRERRGSQVRFVDEALYEKLVSLGFRPSGLALKDGSPPPKKITNKAKSVPNVSARKESTKPSGETEKKTKGLMHGLGLNNIPSHLFSFNNDGDGNEFIAGKPPDQFSDEEDELGQDYNRIRPSVHMRKELPESRPLTAIFSFRDNETMSHADVKFLIETQVEIRVAVVQYDPLDVRATKPGIRSRWTADCVSKDDLNKLLKQGLIIGKDKILMYKFDDIAKREVSSFKYYRTIKSAQKKLGASKSAKKVHTAVKVVTSLRKAVSDKGR